MSVVILISKDYMLIKDKLINVQEIRERLSNLEEVKIH